MKKIALGLLSILLLGLGSPAIAEEDEHLKAVIAGDQRTAEQKARDRYRHPYESLRFFGIRDDMTVLEIYPGGGWYTQILAPYLKDKGKLIAAIYDQDPKTQKKWMVGYNKQFTDQFVGKSDVYGDIEVVSMVPPDRVELAPAGSVDMILDFRNAHNWIEAGGDQVAAGWFKSLKKGGVLGIIEHRRRADLKPDPESGYIHQKRIVDLMVKHGFKLEATSELNSNPKDTTDHPEGVWTLPPGLALGEKESAKYIEIGESDRMTLKFVKP
ncbi:MAG: class I SAM-dependent methyltransferase [Deltaproteobacteria bacterium]|nr:class I SAM-dependent methyltransferase [Deltaproteobacteria bacterium]